MIQDCSFEEIKQEYFKRLYQQKKQNKKQTCRGCKYYKTSTEIKKEFKTNEYLFHSYCSKDCKSLEEIKENSLFRGIKTIACENYIYKN